MVYAIYITVEMSFGFALAACTVSGVPVEERELKLKYALNVMGCRVLPYWLATLAFDFLVFTFIVLLLVVLLVSFDITLMVNAGTVCVYLSSSFSFIGISYTISWLYSKANSAYKTSFLIILFFFMLLPGILIAFFQNKITFTILTIICPSFSMAGGLLVNSSIASAILISNNSFIYVAFQLIQGIMGVALSVYIDTRSLRASTHLDQALIESQEEDVINEAQRVAQPHC